MRKDIRYFSFRKTEETAGNSEFIISFFILQKMLNKAPTEEQLFNGDQLTDSIETTSITQSTRSGSGMTSSLMTSLGATSSYSLKSMASSVSGTLAPSSLGSYSTTTSKSKSSMKKSPTKRYTPSRVKDLSNYPGYNKLRLDSAVSPKHSPRSNGAAEKVRI